METYSVHSFGCRASAADGDSVAAELERVGGLRAVEAGAAEVVVVQTCAVTAEAERSARALIRRVRRENPKARIVVTGCYAQRAPAEMAGLAGVAAVVGNSHRGMVGWVALGLGRSLNGVGDGTGGAAGGGFVSVGDVGAASSPAGAAARAAAPVWQEAFGAGWIAGEHAEAGGLGVGPAGRRTRPILRVQDGCGNRCSFCVIPETRGPSRSVGPEQAVEAARAFAEAGGQELVLSGINLGRWGRDLDLERGRGCLAGLLRALLERTELPRLRVSSVEPMDWDEELLGVFGEYAAGEHARLAPHVHLPLQSGSDAVLRAMHRRYRPWHYAEKVEALRALLPEAAIGADVMVGFPGETERLFRESCGFVEAMPLTYLHVFPFSARPGTRAEALHRANPVADGAARERARAMTELGERKRRAFAERFVGRELPAVVLRDGTALTGNFLRVAVGETLAPNTMARLRIASIEADGTAVAGGAEELRACQPVVIYV